MLSINNKSASTPDVPVLQGQMRFELLDMIANEYNDLIVPRTDNEVFKNNIWHISNGLDNPVTLDFCRYRYKDKSSLGDHINFGYMLFLKIRTFHLLSSESKITAQPFSSKTIWHNLINARAYIIPLLKKYGLLEVNSHNKCIRSIGHLTSSMLDEFISDIIQSKLKKNSKKGILSACIKYLCEDLAVPSIFRTALPIFRASSSTYLTDSINDDDEGFEPIPDDDYFWIGKSALVFINNYAEDIIKLHTIAVDVWKTFPPDEIQSRFNNSTNGQYLKQSYFINHLWRMPELVRRMHSCKANLPAFKEEHRNYWAVECISLPDKDASVESIRLSGFTTTYIFYLFKLLFGALVTILFIPTGMRISEVRLIDNSRICDGPNEDGIYTYINGIVKIKPSGSFIHPNEIPIPIETWRAFHLLDRLTAPLRATDSSMICIPPLNNSYASSCKTDTFGTIIALHSKRIKSDFINTSIASFCIFICSTTIPTSHRFRKSIAEFMLRKTHLAPLLICQLFGHRSISMTLKYLRKNKLVLREMRKYNAERFRDSAVILAIALSNGAAGGRMVEQIHDSVLVRDEFKGLTQPEMGLQLAQYLMNRINNGDLVILHTPLSLCCRLSTAKDKPLCMTGHTDPLDSGFPDPSNCAGVKCNWSIVTFEHTDSLNASLAFYKHTIACIDGTLMRNSLMISHATDMIETYDPILKRIIQIPKASLCKQVDSLRSKMLGCSK